MPLFDRFFGTKMRQKNTAPAGTPGSYESRAVAGPEAAKLGLQLADTEFLMMNGLADRVKRDPVAHAGLYNIANPMTGLMQVEQGPGTEQGAITWSGRGENFASPVLSLHPNFMGMTPGGERDLRSNQTDPFIAPQMQDVVSHELGHVGAKTGGTKGFVSEEVRQRVVDYHTSNKNQKLEAEDWLRRKFSDEWFEKNVKGQKLGNLPAVYRAEKAAKNYLKKRNQQ